MEGGHVPPGLEIALSYSIVSVCMVWHGWLETTYHPGADTAMAGCVRVRLDARPGVGEVGLPQTFLDRMGARRITNLVVDRTGDTVREVVVSGSDVEDISRERAVLDAAVGTKAVAPEAVVWTEHVGGREVAGIVLFVPVSTNVSVWHGWLGDNSRLRSRVPAFIAQESLVCEHVQSVPGEEPPGVVDPPGLVLVCAQEVVKARECALDAGECGPLEHQAALGVEVVDFFGAGERVPERVVSQSESKGGSGTDQARR